MFESRISAGTVGKYQGGRSLRGIVNWQIKTRSSYTMSQVFASISRRRNWNQLENCQKYALKLSSNASTWPELLDLTFCGQ